MCINKIMRAVIFKLIAVIENFYGNNFISCPLQITSDNYFRVRDILKQLSCPGGHLDVDYN